MEDTFFLDEVRRERGNISRAPHFLAKHGLCFNSSGWGQKLEVWEFGRKDKSVTFYPANGKFTINETGEETHGIRNLLTYLKGEEYVKRIDKSKG